MKRVSFRFVERLYEMKTPPDSDGLQNIIVALVTEFEAAMATARERVPGIFRRLCLLGQEWQMNDEEFRGRLVRAGLPASRASELKTVFSVDHCRVGFISGNIVWKKALPMARAHLNAQERFGPAEELAAQIVALMHRIPEPVLDILEGTFELSPIDVPLVGQVSTDDR